MSLIDSGFGLVSAFGFWFLDAVESAEALSVEAGGVVVGGVGLASGCVASSFFRTSFLGFDDALDAGRRGLAVCFALEFSTALDESV